MKQCLRKRVAVTHHVHCFESHDPFTAGVGERERDDVLLSGDGNTDHPFGIGRVKQ